VYNLAASGRAIMSQDSEARHRLEEAARQLQKASTEIIQWLSLVQPGKLVNPIDTLDMKKLGRRFAIVIGTLSVVIVVALALTIHFRNRGESYLICASVAAGLLGSSTAAFRSTLDRRAAGFEDQDGKQWPDPEVRKQRFSLAMSWWLIFRPALGAVTGPLVYWGVVGGVLGCPGKEHTPDRIVFLSLLAGLFAKSLLDLLLKLFKDIFKLGD
jgi:MFS family permease